MIFFGHRFLKSDKFYEVLDIDSIEKTPPSSTLFITFCEKNIPLIEHAVENSIKVATSIQNINEILYASALGASYIIVEKELSKTAHEIAQNYLFDAKILVCIENEEEIGELAILGVDGVVFLRESLVDID